MTTIKSPLMQLIEGKSPKEIGGNIYGLQYRADNKLNESERKQVSPYIGVHQIREGVNVLDKLKEKGVVSDYNPETGTFKIRGIAYSFFNINLTKEDQANVLANKQKGKYKTADSVSAKINIAIPKSCITEKDMELLCKIAGDTVSKSEKDIPKDDAIAALLVGGISQKGYVKDADADYLNKSNSRLIEKEVFNARKRAYTSLFLDGGSSRDLNDHYKRLDNSETREKAEKYCQEHLRNCVILQVTVNSGSKDDFTAKDFANCKKYKRVKNDNGTYEVRLEKVEAKEITLRSLVELKINLYSIYQVTDHISFGSNLHQVNLISKAKGTSGSFSIEEDDKVSDSFGEVLVDDENDEQECTNSVNDEDDIPF